MSRDVTPAAYIADTFDLVPRTPSLVNSINRDNMECFHLTLDNSRQLKMRQRNLLRKRQMITGVKKKHAFVHDLPGICLHSIRL